MQIVDQYTHLGVEISKCCSWDAHIANVLGKGKAHIAKVMGKGKAHLAKVVGSPVYTDSHLDTRSKRCLMNAIVPKLEYAGEVWEGNAKFVKQLETVQHMTAALKHPRMPKYDWYYSIKSRTGNVPTQDKYRRDKVELTM